jgi:hypothetical protein
MLRRRTIITIFIMMIIFQIMMIILRFAIVNFLGDIEYFTIPDTIEFVIFPPVIYLLGYISALILIIVYGKPMDKTPLMSIIFIFQLAISVWSIIDLILFLAPYWDLLATLFSTFSQAPSF